MQIIRLSGPAFKVFEYFSELAKANGNITLGQIKEAGVDCLIVPQAAESVSLWIEGQGNVSC